MSEHQRVLWVHLAVSPIQRGNHTHTLSDVWVLVNIYVKDCRHHLRLSECTQAIYFLQWRLWCLAYCSLSLLNHTSYHLLQHFIFYLAKLRTQRKRGVISHKHRYSKTITRLSNWMITAKHAVKVIQYFSHLIRANETWNTQFINNANPLEALHVFPDDSYLMSGWNWIQMLFASICDIYQRWNEMLARCESRWEYERQYDIYWWKKEPTTRGTGVPNLGWGAPTGSEECPKYWWSAKMGVWSVDINIELTIQTKVHQWEFGSCQAEEMQNGDIECGMKYRSANPDRGAPLGTEECCPSWEALKRGG